MANANNAIIVTIDHCVRLAASSSNARFSVIRNESFGADVFAILGSMRIDIQRLGQTMSAPDSTKSGYMERDEKLITNLQTCIRSTGQIVSRASVIAGSTVY